MQAKSSTPASKRQSRGFSLMEMAIGLCISAVLLSQALPSLDRMIQRQRLNLLAQTLMVDLKHARNDAMLSPTGMHLHFGQSSQGACYVIYTGPAKQCQCDTSGMPVCTGGARAIKSQWLPNQLKIALHSNSNHMTFKGQMGTVTPGGSIDLSTSHGDSIRHIISIAGRVRSCSPNGSMGQHPAC